MTRRAQDPAIRAAYMDARPCCELCETHGFFEPGEPHHMFGGRRGGRLDAVGNLFSLCRPHHEWCEKHKQAGRVLSLYWKWRTGTFVAKDVCRAGGYASVEGFLGMDSVRDCCLAVDADPRHDDVIGLLSLEGLRVALLNALETK